LISLFSQIKNEIDITQSIFLNQLKKNINQKDVRAAFFEILHDIYINSYRVMSYTLSPSFYEDSKQIYFGIQKRENDDFNWKSNFHYGFIIKCFSTFEFCISQICKSILDNTALEKIKSKEYNEIMEILKCKDISEEVKMKFECFKKKYLEHVSINLKLDQIYKFYNIHKFLDVNQINKDKEFLKFFGKLRNSIHSNFVYYGNDYNYLHNGTKYTFIDGKPFKQDPLNDLSLFELSIELRKIYERLIENIEFEKEISDHSYADSLK